MPDIQQAPNMPSVGSGAGYPDASQLPEVNGQADQQAKAMADGAPNPVISALQTIGKFVMTQPKDSPIQMLFKALLEEIGKVGQGGAAPSPVASAPAGSVPPPPAPGAPAGATPPMERPIGAFAGGPGGQDVNSAPGAKLFV